MSRKITITVEAEFRVSDAFFFNALDNETGNLDMDVLAQSVETTLGSGGEALWLRVVDAV